MTYISLYQLLPDAKIIYSDIDPYTYEQARAMAGHRPNVLYLKHDVREARALLESPRSQL